MKTLGERFRESRGAPLSVDDHLVHMIYERSVEFGDILGVHRLKQCKKPVQALRLKIDSGTLSIDGKKLKDIVLWADSSPEFVEVKCLPRDGEKATLKVWNAWRDDEGVMQAWIGNAGVLIDEHESGALLHCSGGTESVDFENLVVDLRFTTLREAGRA